MLQTQWQLLRLSPASFLFPSLSPLPFSRNRCFPVRFNDHYSLCSAHKTWLAQLTHEHTATAITAASSALPPRGGPIELSQSIPSILTAASDSTALQSATSVLLTVAFTLFLFRTIRIRAKRVKEMRFRSSESKKSMAVKNLQRVSKSPVKAKSQPSPDQALLGALIAAVFGLLLYKFTTTIEYALNRQALSDNYSVRQITITIRTIINGLCYLATFVFGFNSLGLFLYSGQLALNSYVQVSSTDGEAQLKSNSELRDVDGSGTTTAASEDQSSDRAAQ